MQFIIYMIISCVTFLIMPIALGIMQKNARMREKKLNKDEFIMKASKAFCISMVIFTVIWVIVIIILNICEDISIWINIVLWGCEVFLILCCIQSFRQEISVTALELFYTPMFGKRRVVKIKDIEKVVVCLYSRGVVKYKIYVLKKVFCSFSNTATGAKLLIDILRESHIPIHDKA